MQPSSANKGFFQQDPALRNQFHDDVSLQRITKLFLSPSIIEKVSPEISQLGDEVISPQIFDWITDSEKNLPYLRGNGRDAFGKPKSELVVGEGWRKLQEFGFKKGIIGYNYDTDFGAPTRVVQFIRLHLFEPSCSNTTCPGAMQDGAASLIKRHLANPSLSGIQRKVFQNAYDHLISRDPQKGWTSGQWMTERTGGSDVSQTETIAAYSPFPTTSPVPLANAEEDIPLGPWSITGFKWFSSATDSNMTILLAKTTPGKGLSAFLAPMRRQSPTAGRATTELNGIRIQRLKNKFGTQGLPTAELELEGMRGWLVGEEGKGIQEISTMLTITRVHSSTAALGYLGRGLGVAKAYALVREVGAGGGRRVPLFRHPLHVRTLASATGEYHGMMLLVFYTLLLLGLEERSGSRGSAVAQARSVPTPPPKHVAPLLRVLSSVQKAYVCDTTIPLLFGCMQALGGVGYLLNTESEPINLARLFRDACVLPIWEGTTDVLCSDTIRALKHRVTGGESLAALGWFVEAGLEAAAAGCYESGWAEGSLYGDAVRKQWEILRGKIVAGAAETLLPDARDTVFRIAEVLIAVLYLVDAGSNHSPAVQVMCVRFLTKKGFVPDGDAKKLSSVKEDLDLDLAVVYGPGGPVKAGELGGASKL